MARGREVPAVARAGVTTAVPMRGVDFLRWVVRQKGQPGAAGNERTVDPEYFRVMNLRLLGGRTITSHDTASAEPVAVVSESFGRRLFGSLNPLGRTLWL